MFKVLEIGFFIVWTAITILISYWLGQASYSWMPPQATAEAQHVDSLFSFLVTLGSAIFLAVFGMIFHSILVCRAPAGDFSEGHPARGNAWIELFWTGVPVLLVLWIGVQGFQVYSLLDLEGLSTISHAHPKGNPATATQFVADSAMVKTGAETGAETIEVTVKQWAWAFHYPDKNVTSSTLHLPVNQRVHLILKSEDVLHGFYVPAFRIKQDIIPNHPIDFTFSPTLEGQYRLNDSQFSGAYFALMEADVSVESAADYQKWLSQAASGSDSSQSLELVADLSADERANPPNLWGQRWAIKTLSPLEWAAMKAVPSAADTFAENPAEDLIENAPES